ncbi:putative ribonuclease H-like domain-containing protein [Tanacetum coccineum]
MLMILEREWISSGIWHCWYAGKETKSYYQRNGRMIVNDGRSVLHVVLDGGGFAWECDMAEDDVQAKLALMAFTESEVDKYGKKSCSIRANYGWLEELKKGEKKADVPIATVERVSKLFSWVFFLRTKDETSEILKNFIKEIENLVDKKVKIIRSDNGTEFKNHVMDEFCREKVGASLVQSDERISLLGFALSSKACRVYKIRTRKVLETCMMVFLENKLGGGNGRHEGSASNISYHEVKNFILYFIMQSGGCFYFKDGYTSYVVDVQLHVQDRNLMIAALRGICKRNFLQFKLKTVWVLVDLLQGQLLLVKWVYETRRMEGNCCKEKSKTGWQGHTQQKGLDYDGTSRQISLVLQWIVHVQVYVSPKTSLFSCQGIISTSKANLLRSVVDLLAVIVTILWLPLSTMKLKYSGCCKLLGTNGLQFTMYIDINEIDSRANVTGKDCPNQLIVATLLKLDDKDGITLFQLQRVGVHRGLILTKTKQKLLFLLTLVILRVQGNRLRIRLGRPRRHSRLVLSECEGCEDDSSKQGRKFSKEGFKDDEGGHEKASTETELFIQEITPTEVIHEQEGSGKASDEISTAGKKKDTASEEVPPVSTAEVHISTAGETATYSRRSAEKRKDKGKGIMTDEEPKKKSKKELEQERLSFAEAIRIEEQMHEEQRAQIARDAEIARQWDEEERKRAMDEAESTKKIDWNDPSVLRYHSLKMKPKSIAQARRNMVKYLKNQGNFKITDFKGMSYNEVRPIFEKLWDFNQKFVPMDAEKASKKQKSPEKERSSEKIVEEEAVPQKEREEVVKEPATKRKKSIPRKTTRKRQKLEEDADKDELKRFLDIVPREEAPIEIESLSTKFPIVDWKTVVLTETFMYYQVFRGDGSSKNYKILSEMLQDFDRMDVEQLFRLVKERYSSSAPEGFDLMLWGDLHTLFEPDEDDEIWKDQHEYNLLSWRLCDFCGIHILLMNNGLAIHMLTEKKYPLSQEMLSKMLSTRLEVDHESSQAFELLRFIRAQVQK